MELTNDSLTSSNDLVIGEDNVTGTGVLDGVLTTVRANLKNEFDSGRITGVEYSETYTALITAALSSSVQYLQFRDSTNPARNKILKDIEVLEKQELLLDKEIEKVEEDRVLVTQQIVTEHANTLTADKTDSPHLYSIIDTANKKVLQETEVLEKQQVVLDMEAAKLEEEKVLITQQVVSEFANTHQSIKNSNPGEGSTIDIANKKAEQETALLKQRTITEYAQTEASNTTDSPTETSVVGQTKIVTDQQAKAFLWESRIAYAKIVLDAYTANNNINDDFDLHLGQIRAQNIPDDGDTTFPRGTLGNILDKAEPGVDLSLVEDLVISDLAGGTSLIGNFVENTFKYSIKATGTTVTIELTLKDAENTVVINGKNSNGEKLQVIPNSVDSSTLYRENVVLNTNTDIVNNIDTINIVVVSSDNLTNRWYTIKVSRPST